MTASTGQKRLTWVDHARGIAIILVVFGHSFRGLSGAGLVAPDSPLRSVDYVIYTFHMPLFFFLSGLFAAGSAGMPARSFWRNRILGILHPYVLWMTVELLLLNALPNVTNVGALSISPARYLYDPLSPFWFLYALMFSQVYVRLCIGYGRLFTAGLATVIFLAGQAASPDIVQSTTMGNFYVAIGAASSGFVRDARFVRLIGSLWLLFACAAGAVVVGLAAGRLDVPVFLVVPGAVLGSVAVFCLAERLSRLEGRFAALAVVRFLGRISLTVLVVHILGTASTRIVLTHVFHEYSVWLNLAAGTAIGLLLPITLQRVSTRLHVNRALGLPVLQDGRRIHPPPVTV